MKSCSLSSLLLNLTCYSNLHWNRRIWQHDMGNTLWFITILKDQPWIGFLIGLAFITVMFGSKNLIVYFYAKNQEKKRLEKEDVAGK